MHCLLLTFILPAKLIRKKYNVLRNYLVECMLLLLQIEIDSTLFNFSSIAIVAAIWLVHDTEDESIVSSLDAVMCHYTIEGLFPLDHLLLQQSVVYDTSVLVFELYTIGSFLLFITQ